MSTEDAGEETAVVPSEISQHPRAISSHEYSAITTTPTEYTRKQLESHYNQKKTNLLQEIDEKTGTNNPPCAEFGVAGFGHAEGLAHQLHSCDGILELLKELPPEREITLSGDVICLSASDVHAQLKETLRPAESMRPDTESKTNQRPEPPQDENGGSDDDEGDRCMFLPPTPTPHGPPTKGLMVSSI